VKKVYASTRDYTRNEYDHYKLLFVEMVRQAVNDLRRANLPGQTQKRYRYGANAAEFLRSDVCEELLGELHIGQAEMLSRLRAEGLKV
jgi:hypothetical protein